MQVAPGVMPQHLQHGYIIGRTIRFDHETQRPTPVMLPQGVEDRPENGHRFRIKVYMVGASSIMGPEDVEPHSHRDHGWESEMQEVVVRAHSLPEALTIAATLPLTAYLPPEFTSLVPTAEESVPPPL